MAMRVDRSLRLPESEYFSETQAKSGMAQAYRAGYEAVHAAGADFLLGGAIQ